MKKVLLTVSAIAFSVASFSLQASGETAYNSLGCGGCHGPAGRSTNPLWPNLAGQHAAYTVKQLKDFQSGARKDPSMGAMAALSAGKEQAIADYLAAQK